MNCQGVRMEVILKIEYGQKDVAIARLDVGQLYVKKNKMINQLIKIKVGKYQKLMIKIQYQKQLLLLIQF